ncbi:VirB4-like conjugal transfer ATPase, CD1110 family [Gemmiger formicilis]|uniref:VirB4-like conjugal transfer ATPase, CD1110 family n=1 Tax=Gemmiger formicilis TaxID=745368 RepID=UPI00351FC971
MPRSVQQSIPIDRIYADGVWQSENVFSLMWQISDINYAMQSDAAKQNILTQLGTVYAGIPADCWMQVCIVSQRMDEKAFARDVLYHRENDGFDALRAERNRQIKANARENGNVVQHKYIIVSTNKPGVKEARERFVQVQGHLLSAFSALECAVTPLDNRARLEVLHKFFRISEEGRFNFDFDNCAKLGQDFRDSIAPDCIRFCKKHIEIEDFYAKCMTISEYPQQLDDKFISALLQQVPYIVLSIDIEPVETEDAFKEIDNAQMKTDAEKVRFNKKSVENLDFTSSVPQRTQEQDRIIASIRKEMTENDQQMFLSLLTVTYFADTLEDLALETDALKTTAANYNCRFTELYFQQERAFDTAMPYGLRRIESVRTMLTKSLTALVPFNTQEILTPGGICYGRNAVTGNLIIGLRTSLVNGNAMVVATSGGGESMFVKLEILMLYLRFTKARFYVVDPENEYAPLVQELGGEVVNISVDSATHFNPLDFKYDKATKIPPHVAKAEFVLSLCEQICGPRRRANAPPSSGRNHPKNTHKPRCSRAFPMWLPVQATPPKAPPA